jgi:Transglutaminase-like superfamily
MTRRQAAAWGVLVVWLAAVGWLVRRVYWKPAGAALAEGAALVAPGANYFRLDVGGRQVGFASSTVDTMPDELRVKDVMVTEVPALGKLQHADARTEAHLTRTMRLKSFLATLRTDDGKFSVTGTVAGDSLLHVSIATDRDTQTVRVPLTEPIVLPGLLPLRLVFGHNLAVGRAYAIRLFDPLLLQAQNVGIKVTAESTFIIPDSARYDSAAAHWVPARYDTVHAWHIAQQAGAVTADAWIDDLGQIVAANTLAGFSMTREAFELAFENFRKRDTTADLAAASDIVQRTAVQAGVSLNGPDVRRLTVRLGGVPLAGFDLDGGRQTLAGDTLRIVQENGDALDTRMVLPASASHFAAELRSEPLIQSADPRVGAMARQIAGRQRYAARVARLLNDWVHENIEQQVTVSVPSAVDVLSTRRGDCNEITVLYVAMARALGLPARTAAGLVYVRGRFYYHAWPEVYLGRWVAVDPTFGQFPADAAHLRFTIGGLARQLELAQLFGRLTISVVGVENTP